MRYISILLLASMAALTFAKDMKMTLGNIEVNVMGKSGKITLIAKRSGSSGGGDGGGDGATTTEPEPTTTTTKAPTTTAAPARRRRDADEEKGDNKLMIDIDSLTEVDSNGAAVGTTGNQKHSINSFASVDFTFTDIKTMAIPSSDAVNAKTFDFEATLGTGSKLKISMFIAEEDGNITLNGERTPISKGQIKFSVVMSEWTWCTQADENCKKGSTVEVGAFVDLKITISGKGDAKAKEAVAKEAAGFSLGDNTLYMSKQIEKTATDNAKTWVDMADKYPKMEAKEGGKTSFTLRFPTFEKSVWYDPSIEMAVPGGDTMGAASITVNVLLVAFALVLALRRL